MPHTRTFWEFGFSVGQILAVLVAAYLAYNISTQQVDVAIQQLEPAISSTSARTDTGISSG